MSKPVIVITGAGGFIGSHLVKHFQKMGWRVRALMRNLPQERARGVEYHEYDLFQDPDEKSVEAADYLVHCALVQEDVQINIEGTEKLLSLARVHKLKKFVFMSSMSALPDALSGYGRQKYALQQMMTGRTEVALRPGLVVGDGGLFKEMETFIRKRSLVPLIAGGRQPVQTVFIDDLAMVVERVIERDLSGVYTVATDESIYLKDVYLYIARQNDKRVTFIDVPFGLVYAAVAFSSRLGIKLPATKEGLLGMRRLSHQPTRQDLQKLGVELRSLR